MPRQMRTVAAETKEGVMKRSESEIVSAARNRIARLFGMAVENVRAEYVFGKEIQQVTAKSDFKYGAYDQILHDIRDVADRPTLKRINAGTVEIRTVDDYCKHMFQCYETNEDAVLATLELK